MGREGSGIRAIAERLREGGGYDTEEGEAADGKHSVFIEIRRMGTGRFFRIIENILYCRVKAVGVWGVASL